MDSYEAGQSIELTPVGGGWNRIRSVLCLAGGEGNLNQLARRRRSLTRLSNSSTCQTFLQNTPMTGGPN